MKPGYTESLHITKKSVCTVSFAISYQFVIGFLICARCFPTYNAFNLSFWLYAAVITSSNADSISAVDHPELFGCYISLYKQNI